MNDLRSAIRTLRRRPGLALTAALTLALGIGASTTIFALVDATLLNPLSAPEADRLVTVYTSDDRNLYRSFVYSDFVDLADRQRTLTGVAAWVATDVSLAGAGSAERVAARMVSANYFDVLRIPPAAGRPFVADDDRAGAPPVAMLSADLARRRFGSVAEAVGRTIRLNGATFTVTGVAPRTGGPDLGGPTDVWVPMANYGLIATGFFANFDAVDYAAQRGPQRLGLWRVFGRLRNDLDLTAARRDLERIAAGLAEEFPETNADRSFTALPAAQAAVPPAHRADAVRFLGILGGTVLFTLLIACANVANLLLARTLDRTGEIGVRLALGATRARVGRQLLAECLVIAGAGAVLGVGVAYWGVDLLGTFRLPGGLAIEALDLSVDGRLLVFAAGLAVFTAAVAGVAPAFRASRLTPTVAIGAGPTRGTTARGRLRQSLVAVQVGLGLVLLVGAGLFARSLQQAFATDLGFDAQGVLTLTVHLGEADYESTEARTFYDALLERVEARPEVAAAGVTSTPFGTEGLGVGTVYAAERGEAVEAGRVTITRASAGFFTAAGMRLQAGRMFDGTDGPDDRRTAIVSARFAALIWPGESAVGRTFTFSGPDGSLFTVAGVVSDAVFEGVGGDPAPHVFLPLAQHAGAAAGDPMTLYVRSIGRPALVAGPVREIVRSLDPSLPVFDVMALEDRVAGTLGPQRFGRALLGVLALIGLALAVVGVYAVTAYGVAGRTREFGIRIALGARAPAVAARVLREATIPVVIGLLAGAGVALGGARLAGRFLFGVAPHDAAAFLAGGLLLAAAALVAAWVPARRAARINPVEALRHE